MELRRGWVGRRVDSRSTASSSAGCCTSGGGRRASDGARACHDRGTASAASTVVSIDEWGAGVGAGVVEVMSPRELVHRDVCLTLTEKQSCKK
jgi:hypothetical protein